MKVRESGMPEAAYWASLFDVPLILDALGLDGGVNDAAEFGCGSGTFAVPAAQRIRRRLHAFDIEPDMIAATRQLAERAGCGNVRLHLRDLAADGTGLPPESVEYAMLFNILHAEDPQRLLAEARRILAPGGRVGVIHWNYDPATPRGPPMEMRPRPENCRRWIAEAGFALEKPHVDLPPHHYGILARKERP